MKSRWLIAIITVVYLSVALFNKPWKENIFTWDRSGYYMFLPALFIHQDLEQLAFYEDVKKTYYPADVERWYVYEQPIGRKLIKYSVGTALSELPFFLAAHVWCKAAGTHAADGYTSPYRFAVMLSSIFWTVAGLILLRLFLRKYFRDTTVFIVLACIAFGTNLYYYTAYYQGMSHPFSFFLFAAVLWLTHQFYQFRQNKYLLLLGLVLGLITITRPVNIIVAVLPLLWGMSNVADFKERFAFFFKRWKALLLSLLLFTLVAFIQLAYWQYATGHWVFFSYQEEGFNFAHSKMWKGLFSWRKGWFVYTPIAFIGILGIFSLWRSKRELLPALLLFFTLIIYVTFSWRNWWYGGSFGCRPLIDILPVVALPLAAITEQMLRYKKIVIALYLTLLSFFIALNIFQSWQYEENIIHWDRMSRAYYIEVFGKTETEFEKIEHLLLSEKEYWQEMKEISEGN